MWEFVSSPRLRISWCSRSIRWPCGSFIRFTTALAICLRLSGSLGNGILNILFSKVAAFFRLFGLIFISLTCNLLSSCSAFNHYIALTCIKSQLIKGKPSTLC